MNFLVSGMIGLLSDANLEPEPKEYVNTLEKSVDSLMNLINDSLNFSRVIFLQFYFFINFFRYFFINFLFIFF